ncbi:MAG: hypothetical protein HY735_07160 [Verrucomicrobia bacterium]|nr:hypothetical protein [Verrucomicrobiota bacterium]
MHLHELIRIKNQLANPTTAEPHVQIDVRIEGNSAASLGEMKGFHWMTSCGVYLREAAAL